MLSTLTPSSWAARRFPGCWEHVADALAAAGLAAHERALDAKNGSQLDTNEAYGATFWLALPQEAAVRLAALPEVTVIPPGNGRRYPLVALGDSLLFPARFGNGSQGADQLVLHPSGLRSEIMAIRDWPNAGVQMPFDLGPEFDRADEPSRVQQLLADVTRTILVAYDCDPRAGLQHVYLGEAILDAVTGDVTWLYREELPLGVIRGLKSITGLSSDDASFNNAPLPDVSLQLRDEEAAGIADE